MTTPTMAAASGTHQAFKRAARGNLPIAELFQAALTLTEAGQRPRAIELYRSWLQHTPSPLAYAARFNLAVVLGDSGDTAGAEAAYRAALEQNPRFCEAQLNLGTLLERLKRPDEALAAWRRVLDITDPAVPAEKAHRIQALNNLGRLMEIGKDFPGAEAMLTLSLRLDAAQPNVITHWVHLRQKQCKWPVYDSAASGIAEHELMASTSALAMLSGSGDPAWQLAASRRFITDKVVTDVAPLASPDGYRHGRLRVGYLSSDFCSHAVSILTAELYGLHDRSPHRGLRLRLEQRRRLAAARPRAGRHGPPRAHPRPDRRAGRARHPRRRDRHPGRPARPDAGRPSDDFVVPAGAGADHVAGPARPHRPPRHRLRDRRPLRAAARAGAVFHGTAAAHAAHLPDQRPPAHHRRDADAGRLRPAGRRHRVLRLQQRLQDQPRHVRRLDAHPAAGAGQPAVAGVRPRGRARQPAARGRAGRRRPGAPAVRRPRGAGRLPGALPGGRPVPRHGALQRRHHGQRRAVGRPAGADLQRPHLLVAHGRQPAAGGRPAGTDHLHAGRLRGTGRGAGARPARAWPP